LTVPIVMHDYLSWPGGLLQILSWLTIAAIMVQGVKVGSE